VSTISREGHEEHHLGKAGLGRRPKRTVILYETTSGHAMTSHPRYRALSHSLSHRRM